jgi:hypothetical protein
LASAAQVTESYISQLLTRKKTPPAEDRTDLYAKLNAFLKLPEGQLSTLVRAQRREELKKKLADPPAPLFKEFRELIIGKCNIDTRAQVRDIFEKQAFGELERLVTQKLLDVTKTIVRDELKNESWLRGMAKQRRQSYEELRATSLEFLDTDMFNVSVDHCARFLDPAIDTWNMDLKTFALEIILNKRATAAALVKFEFVEVEDGASSGIERGFKSFLQDNALSGDATDEEIEFLKRLRFKRGRPTSLYYYRELQSLRDPLHFPDRQAISLLKHGDAENTAKKGQMDSRKNAVRRWGRNDSVAKRGKARK